MEFELNTKAREERINDLVEAQIRLIKSVLAQGERTIELYIPKELASEVKDRLEPRLGDNFIFQTVRRDTNQYTGKIQSFGSMVVGDDRYYKLYYNR